MEFQARIYIVNCSGFLLRILLFFLCRGAGAIVDHINMVSLFRFAANQAHFPALKVLAEQGVLEVVAVADIRAEVAEETAKRHGVPAWYQDPQQMLDEVKPDFVSVCTPNVYHKHWTIQALKAGAHVAWV